MKTFSVSPRSSEIHLLSKCYHQHYESEKACELGLQVKPWVKTSLAPGSKVVTDYLDESGLTTTLQERFMSILKQYCGNLVEQEQIKMILFKNSLRK